MIRKVIMITVVLYLAGCSTVPVTGRKQLTLVPNSQLLSLSFDSYKQVLKDNKLSTNMEETNMVKNVGVRIKGAVEAFMKEQKLESELKNFQWEFNLLESEQVNAFCMPGGKVAFYTGIMPLCKNETGVAVVMGHEVAHAIANHGGERMSQGLIQQFGGVAVAVALSEKPKETQDLAMAAYGVGSTVLGILPYSRLQESEADKMGLVFMAMAGYNPEEAPVFWERMSAQSKGSPPQFLSTHPAHETRIKELRDYMPKALKYYKK
ncbi:MAG TPA: M48 family metallopeptidase [Bacteroidales bacterium]|nr:M48 family metallopeptidase [Bacteroidales bacterium]